MSRWNISDAVFPQMRQLDWEKETPKMMSARKNGNNVLEYRSLLFSIRAVKSAIISDTSTYAKYNPLTPNQKDKTPFGIITTIKNVSKSAVERNRVRTRFKEAVRLALTRSPSEAGEAANANSGNGSEQVHLPLGKSTGRVRLPTYVEASWVIQDTTILPLSTPEYTPNR